MSFKRVTKKLKAKLLKALGKFILKNLSLSKQKDTDD